MNEHFASEYQLEEPISITVKVPKKFYNFVRRHAAQEGKTISHITTDILRKFYNNPQIVRKISDTPIGKGPMATHAEGVEMVKDELERRGFRVDFHNSRLTVTNNNGGKIEVIVQRLRNKTGPRWFQVTNLDPRERLFIIGITSPPENCFWIFPSQLFYKWSTESYDKKNKNSIHDLNLDVRPRIDGRILKSTRGEILSECKEGWDLLESV